MALDILIIDDEDDIRDLIAGILEDEGYEARQAHDADSGLNEIARRRPSLVFLDIWMQGSRLDGLQLLDVFQSQHPDMPVVMISGHGNVETAVSAIRRGAYDYIEKPFKADRLVLVAERALETSSLKMQVKDLQRRSSETTELIGKSGAINSLRQTITRVAPTNSRVLISGPSGSGKELVARAVHEGSPRRNGPFVAVNAAALSDGLLESELFGHVKGAFTGAIRDKIGMFQAADKGTLFLDEIGDVSPLLQLKLLRVIQEREIRRVGDDRPMPVDVRLITATNRDLKQLVQTGDFREDFYYRIHVFEIPLPPLRERRDDIPLLVDHFIRDLAATLNKPVTGIARDALERMMDYDWPGNVRELRNAVEHAFVTVNGDTISLLDLPPDVRRSQPSTGRRPGRTTVAATPATLTPEQQQERERIVAALEQTGGNRTAAARLLETSRVTLWKKIRKYAIEA